MDDMAKEAAQLVFSNIPVPYTDFTQYFKEQAKIETERHILKESDFKDTKYFKYFYDSGPKPWFAYKNLPIDFICWVNRLRANHYHLAALLYRVNLANDPR